MNLLYQRTQFPPTKTVENRLKIFTWHIPGSYLYYLSQGDYDIYLPIDKDQTEGYGGRGKTFPFANNVHEVPVTAVKELEFDCILFQSAKNYLTDQYQIFSARQAHAKRICRTVQRKYQKRITECLCV